MLPFEGRRLIFSFYFLVGGLLFSFSGRCKVTFTLEAIDFTKQKRSYRFVLYVVPEGLGVCVRATRMVEPGGFVNLTARSFLCGPRAKL